MAWNIATQKNLHPPKEFNIGLGDEHQQKNTKKEEEITSNIEP